MLAEVLADNIISTIITAFAGALAGYLIARLKHIGKREKARITIEKATARRLIFEAYEDHVIQKKRLTVDRKREITETFEAYKTLGGNGTAQDYFDKIEGITPYMVTN